MTIQTDHETIGAILSHAKRAAVEYQKLTGKPLGITGEVGECIAAQLLGLDLGKARTPGYDAIDKHGRRIQIKCRRVVKGRKGKSQRIGAVRFRYAFDIVMLVIIDDTFEPVAIYEADAASVQRILELPGSKARNERSAMSVSAFRRSAIQVWPSV